MRKVQNNQANKVNMFRFQDLEVWKKAIGIADKLEKKRLSKFAEQVRAAGLSMSNNISEGSGSFSDKEFA